MSQAFQANLAEQLNLGARQLAAGMFGGKRMLGRPPRTDMDAHDLIERGLPADALVHLVEEVALLRQPGRFEALTGISLRTYQRKRAESAGPLDPVTSGRVWKFAEVLARATTTLGSRAEAEAWLQRPALALQNRVPLDMLSTPKGTEMVEALLGRIEHGVYT